MPPLTRRKPATATSRLSAPVRARLRAATVPETLPAVVADAATAGRVPPAWCWTGAMALAPAWDDAATAAAVAAVESALDINITVHAREIPLARRQAFAVAATRHAIAEIDREGPAADWPRRAMNAWEGVAPHCTTFASTDALWALSEALPRGRGTQVRELADSWMLELLLRAPGLGQARHRPLRERAWQDTARWAAWLTHPAATPPAWRAALTWLQRQRPNNEPAQRAWEEACDQLLYQPQAYPDRVLRAHLVAYAASPTFQLTVGAYEALEALAPHATVAELAQLLPPIERRRPLFVEPFLLKALDRRMPFPPEGLAPLLADASTMVRDLIIRTVIPALNAPAPVAAAPAPHPDGRVVRPRRPPRHT